jgi:hypothetical protein
MQRWLLIDDNKRWEDVLNLSWPDKLEKQYPDVEFHIAKTYQEGVKKLGEGNWDVVYVDQDLGDNNANGYDVLDLVKAGRVPKPGEMYACSGHPGHRGVMHKMIEQLYGKRDSGEKIERY